MDSQFKLRFVAKPGDTYGYSGEGTEYVAKFAQNKTNVSFDALVSDHIFDVYGLDNTSISPEDWVLPNLAMPVDSDGVRHKPFCSGPASRYCNKFGKWSAADEMVTTVEDYTRFMIAVMKGEGISKSMQKGRFTIQTSTADDEILSCKLEDPRKCPTAQGYGLGWEIFEFGDAKIVSHGGSDWSERAMVYFDVHTLDGVVLFINGHADTSTEALIDGLYALDDGSKIAMLYRGWVDAYKKKTE